MIKLGGMKPFLGAQLRIGHPIARGLVGYWPMSENSGKRINDLSNNNNAGTLYGDTKWVAGKFGSCLRFDGVGDYVQAANVSKALLLTGPRTVAVWVKLGATGLTNKYVFSCRTIIGGDNDNYALVYGWVSQKFEYYAEKYTGTSPRTALTTAINDTLWHHIVFTHDGSTVNGYLDGKLDVTASKSTTYTPVAANFNIGTCLPTSGNWQGDIDGVQIVNRVWTASEILQLYLDPFCMFRKDP